MPFALAVWAAAVAAPWLDPRVLLVAGGARGRRRGGADPPSASVDGAAGRRAGGARRRGCRRRRPRPGAGGVAVATRSPTQAARSPSSWSWTAIRTRSPAPGARPGRGRCVGERGRGRRPTAPAGRRRSCCSRPPRVVGPAPGQRVRARVGAALPREGIRSSPSLAARGPPTPLGGPGPLQRAAGALRDGLAASAGRVLEPRPAGLLPGLVVGDTRAMDPVLTEDFRRAGLGHLTAVSGANVAIVLACVLWPLRRRAADRRVQAVVAGLALVAFVVLARPSPSVVRAAAMGAVALLALATGRSRAAVPALAAAVACSSCSIRGWPSTRLRAVRPRDGRHRAARAGLVTAAPGPRVLAGSRRRAGRQRGGGTGDGATGGRARRDRQPGVPPGEPAGRARGRAGDGAGAGGGRRRADLARGCRRAGVARGLADGLAGGGGATAAALPDGATGWPAGGRRRRAARRRCCSGLAPVALPAAPAARPRRGGRPGRRWAGPCAGGPWLAAAGHPRRRLRRGAGRRDRPAHRGGAGSSSTPVPTSGRSTGAWTGWASRRCRWSSSPTSTPTTSAAWPGRWRDGTWGRWRRHASRRPTTGRPPSPPSSTGPGAGGHAGARATGARSGRVRRRCSPRTRRSATASAAPNDLSMVVRAEARGLSILLTGDLERGGRGAPPAQRRRPARRRPQGAAPRQRRRRTRSSWPRAGPGSPWCPSAQTTPTVTPRAAHRLARQAGCRSIAPTGKATSRWPGTTPRGVWPR